MIPLALTAVLLLATAGAGPTAPLVAQLDSEASRPADTRVIYVAEPEQDRSHRWLFLGGGILVLTGIYMALRAKHKEPPNSRPGESEVDDDR